VSYAIFLPVLALLLLLLLPLPTTVRHYAVRFVKAVLFFRLQVTGFRNGVPLSKRHAVPAPPHPIHLGG
jgi:hypothetical protein